jgi:hypothetical protein
VLGQARVWELDRPGFQPQLYASWKPGLFLTCKNLMLGKAQGQPMAYTQEMQDPFLPHPPSEATQARQMVAGEGRKRIALQRPLSGLSGALSRVSFGSAPLTGKTTWHGRQEGARVPVSDSLANPGSHLGISSIPHLWDPSTNLARG